MSAVHVRRHVRRTPSERKAAAKDISVRYGPSRPNTLSPFAFAPTDENIATMPFIREEAGQDSDILVPVPPQHPSGSFVDYEKADAEALAKELRKLVDEPVILTGGGGTGVRFMFLEQVQIVAFPPCLKGPDGRCLPSDEWKKPAKPGREHIDVWYVPDPKARPEDIHYRVKVKLRRLPGDKPHPLEAMKEEFSPWVGSWRVTAIGGYGAEKLRKGWPPGWE